MEENQSQNSNLLDQYPGNIIDVNQADNYAFKISTSNNVSLHIKFLSDTIINFRYFNSFEPKPVFSYGPDKKSSVLSRNPTKPIAVKQYPDVIIFSTVSLEIEIERHRLLKTIKDRDGNTILKDEKGYHWENSAYSGGEIVKMTKHIQGGEHFYGLGDKSSSIDLRGQSFTLWGEDRYGFAENSDPLYKNIPFFTAQHKDKKYGVYMDNSYCSHFDFGKAKPNLFSFWAEGGEMNYYFFYGNNLTEITAEYTQLTGLPELPPMWALGYHQSRRSYFPDKAVQDLCENFRKQKIPCDAVYLDIDYMDSFKCFSWNEKHFPNPKQLIEKIKETGFKTVCILDPGIKVQQDYDVCTEGLREKHFCQRMDGDLLKANVWPGPCYFPDFTNPKTRDWWAERVSKFIKTYAISGIWNDMNEPTVFDEGSFPTDTRHDYDGNPCSHQKAHNVYGMLMCEATIKGQKIAFPAKRPFNLSRSGFSGIQRYSAVWTGDNVANWEHIKIANRQVQRLASSGISFAGSDIGGFLESPSGELYTRWIQMGCFHPFFRTHSSGDHGDQKPWSFGEPFTSEVKKYIELRYRLLPYLYSRFYTYCQDGTPIIHSINALDEPDPETSYREGEFGFGPDFIICPVTEIQPQGKWIYLPKGTWYDYWNDELHQGRHEIWTETPLDKIPVYVKAGSAIPYFPVQQYVGEKKPEELEIHIYPPGQEKQESFIYIDDGEGYNYLKEDFLKLKILVAPENENQFTVKLQSEGQYQKIKVLKMVFHNLPADQSIQYKQIKTPAKKLQTLTFNNLVLPFLELKVETEHFLNVL